MDNPVADNVYGVFPEDTGRYRAENKSLAFEMERVSGIGSALEPCHCRILSREDINYLSLAFISPLEAEDYVEFHYMCDFIRFSV